MCGTQNLGLFLLSVIVLYLTPGQETLHICARSVAQGRQAGFLAVSGIISGVCIHTCAVAFGLSALIASSAHALLAVKLIGGAYLVYMGMQMAFSRSMQVALGRSLAIENPWGIYRAGFICNLFNPKAILFFMAFLPQFVAPGGVHKIPVFFFLGGIILMVGTFWSLALVLFASALTHRLRDNPSTGVLLQRGAGALFVVVGLSIAWGH